MDVVDLEAMKHDFYAFLKSTFHAVTDDSEGIETSKKEKNKELKENEKQLNEFAEKGEEEVQDDSGSGGCQIAGEDRPSVQWPGIKTDVIKENQAKMADYQAESEAGSDAKLDLEVDSKGKGLGQSLMKMCSGLGSAIADLGVSLRDNLFLCDYTMNMFSYDTVEKEAVWETAGSDPSLSNIKNSFAKDSVTLGGRPVPTIVYGGDGTSMKEGLSNSQEVQRA